VEEGWKVESFKSRNRVVGDGARDWGEQWRWRLALAVLGGFLLLFFFFQTKKVKEGWMIQCFAYSYLFCSRLMCQSLIDGHKALVFCHDRTKDALN
jgi:hypothetical protein